MHGSGPKETSSSLTSTIFSSVVNLRKTKSYRNYTLIQFLRANCNIIEATDMSCGMKISRREVLNFHISGSIRRKKALETGKCSVV